VLRSRGRELMGRPLEERRARLLELIPKKTGALMPSRILRGDVPFRDINSYGNPLSIYVLAGVFSTFGISLMRIEL